MDCFIRKNTPELRNKLKANGIRWNNFDDNKGEWIAFNSGMYISVSQGHDRMFPEHIDCGVDEDLFIDTIKKKK